MRAAGPTSIVPTKLYPAIALAAYLGIQPRTLETWRRKGKHPELRFRRIGRRIRYLGADILRFLDAGMSPRPRRKRRAR